MKNNRMLKNYTFAFTLLSLIGASSCQNEKDPEPAADCSLSTLELAVENIQTASGCEINDGSLTVTAVGGEGEVTFSIDDDAFQSSGTFSDLVAGTYTITAMEENGCKKSVEATVGLEGSDLAISSVSSADSGCKETQGELTVTATGDGSLMYKLNDGAFQASNIFSNLASGTYEVVVKDATNCEVSAQKKVLNGTSYDQQVKEIIMTNCAISGCHNGDNGASRNWTVFENVQNKADRIKEFTQSGFMPQGDGTLTQQEKDLIACWVDDGALNN